MRDTEADLADQGQRRAAPGHCCSGADLAAPELRASVEGIGPRQRKRRKEQRLAGILNVERFVEIEITKAGQKIDARAATIRPVQNSVGFGSPQPRMLRSDYTAGNQAGKADCGDESWGAVRPSEQDRIRGSAIVDDAEQLTRLLGQEPARLDATILLRVEPISSRRTHAVDAAEIYLPAAEQDDLSWDTRRIAKH